MATKKKAPRAVGPETFASLISVANGQFIGGYFSKDALFLSLQVIAKMQRNGELRCRTTLREAAYTCVQIDGQLAGGNLDLHDRLYGIGALQCMHSCGFWNDIVEADLQPCYKHRGVNYHFTESPDSVFGLDWDYDTTLYFEVDPKHIVTMVGGTNLLVNERWDHSDILELRTK